MIKQFLFLSLFLIMSFITTEASANRFCFEFDIDFVDNGIGEDRLTTNDFVNMRYNRVTILKESTQSFVYSGYLNAQGCTDFFFWEPGVDYEVRVYTFGKTHSPRNQYIFVRDFADKSVKYDTLLINPSSNSLTHTIKIGGQRPNVTPELNVYMAAAYSVYHNSMSNVGDFNIYVGASDSYYDRTLGTGYLNPAVYIKTTSEHERRKFVIVHEMGHHVLSTWTNEKSYLWSSSGLYQGPCTGSSTTGNSHSMTSEEWGGSSFDEGFAHFFAARAWNFTTENNCKYKYWSTEVPGGDPDPTINCEGSNNIFVVKYLKNNCSSGTINGHGVELDWMRTFWDLVTDACPDPPNIHETRDWLSDVQSWDYRTAYQDINAEAQNQPAVKDCWNTAKVWNRINYPWSGPDVP